MTLECKIWGVTDTEILNFIINHRFPPQYVGFIVNYNKSKRFVQTDRLKDLIDVDKKKSNSNIIIETKLYLARPVVFKLMKTSFDVFHG